MSTIVRGRGQPPRVSPARIRRGLRAIEAAREFQAELLRKNGGQLYDESTPYLDEARAESRE